MKIKDNVLKILKDITPKKISEAISEDGLSQYCDFIKRRIMSAIENVDKEDNTTDGFGEFQLYTKWKLKVGNRVIPVHVSELKISEYDGLQILVESDSKDVHQYYRTRQSVDWCKEHLIKNEDPTTTD